MKTQIHQYQQTYTHSSDYRQRAVEAAVESVPDELSGQV